MNGTVRLWASFWRDSGNFHSDWVPIRHLLELYLCVFSVYMHTISSLLIPLAIKEHRQLRITKLDEVGL
jgi:hypothetical protein